MRRSFRWKPDGALCRSGRVAALLLMFGCVAGCRTVGPTIVHRSEAGAATAPAARASSPASSTESALKVRLAGHQETSERQEGADDSRPPLYDQAPAADAGTSAHATGPDDWQSLEWAAESGNPELLRLQQETAAAWAKVRYVDKLPDPTIGGSLFGHPIETAAGSQRANLSIMQMIQWLDRLDAQARQACFEAMAMQQMYQGERLRVIGDLRSYRARLYVLGRQLETIDANQQILESISELVNARIAQNRGSAGDVTLLTVELGRLQEQRIAAQQQIRTTQAEMNRLAGRPADTPVAIPTELPTVLPAWSYEMLRNEAWERQPLIAAAHLRTDASRWGIEVARLRRRPDVSLGANWFVIDNNRPPSMVVDVGQDAWSVGAQVSIPLWSEKYDAMRDEATWKHFAAHSSIEDLRLRFDAMLRDLWEQASAAHDTAVLYRTTIIPQARQTFEADQQALANGTVDLDRVLQDIRNLLTLELGYDRSLGQLATAIARIQQAVGADLDVQ
jgi:outer membrane protein, heavy metal efflux system